MKKTLFISYDGGLTVDSNLSPRALPALLRLQQAGFRLVLLANGKTDTDASLMRLLDSQGILIDEVLRGTHLEIVSKYLRGAELDTVRSGVIGDSLLAESLAVRCLEVTTGWEALAEELVCEPRRARVARKTKETQVEIEVSLDGAGACQIFTGIGYFDHMLEQLSKHGGFGLTAKVTGDLHVDEHHTVEDTALALGEALRRALGDKIGIGRYGFVLPMDEAEARVSVDLSGRPYAVFTGKIPRETVGELPTELVPHFFHSLATTLGATLHIEVSGENAHHMIESAFKGVGRALRPAFSRNETGGLPSTKGVL